MSQYISSFFIEPVIRQARRFPRPSFGGSEQVAQHRDGLATAAMGVQGEQPNLRDNLTGEDNDQRLRGNPETASLQDWDTGNQQIEGFRLVELDNLEPAVPARQYTLQTSSDVSYNPQHVLSGSFRSNTSSLTDSSRSLMDTLSLVDAQSLSSSARIDGPHDQTREQSASLGDKTLPEDDGMSYMRRRILAIQRTDSSNEVKARLVHGLMTEKHNASQPSFHDRAHSPISIQSSDRPFTPSSPKSTDSLHQTVSPTTSSSSAGYNANPFRLTPEDLKPTYCEKPSLLPKDTDESEGKPRALGCAHYKRNIKLQCSSCNRWYTCRFCHDAVEDHVLNRRETKNMLCMLCGCAQSASGECALCSERGAWYYCDLCKLWDDDPQKSIYHCDDCGICRMRLLQHSPTPTLDRTVSSTILCLALVSSLTHRPCWSLSPLLPWPLSSPIVILPPTTIRFLPAATKLTV
ncbi:MAG: hypothetical protein Q9163_000417 [Psora crenata]